MFLLPTLNRIEKLKTFLKSAKDTGMSEPGRIVIDKDDFKKHEEAYITINNTMLPNDKWALEITEGVTMAAKCREIIPKLKPETEYVALLNDDHLCVSPEWDKKLIKRLDGKNFVSANDRRLEAFRFPVTATAWSMPLLKCLGWPIYPPFLEHLFIDNLWLELGRATGCWRMVASAVVTHNHVLWGGGVKDETHSKVYGENFENGEPGQMWKDDEANFKTFMQGPDFPEAVRRIKALQDYLPGEQWNPKVSANA